MQVPDDETPRLLTPAEVAAVFRVSPATIARWICDGKLRAVVTPSGRKLIRPQDVTAFTESRGRSSVSRGIVDRLARELAEHQDDAD